MAVTFDDFFNELRDMTYNDKVKVGRKIYQSIIKVIDENLYGNFFVESHIVAKWYYTIFAIADRKVGTIEATYFNDISGSNMSYNEFFEECKENDHPEMKAMLKSFFKSISKDEIGYFDALGMLIFSLKNVASEFEREFIDNFISLN